jgi:hypothetical protein
LLLGALAVHCGSAKQYDDDATGGRSGAGGSNAQGGMGASNNEPCTPQATRACQGTKACDGEQICRDDGTGYDACVCAMGASGAAGQAEAAGGEQGSGAGAPNGGGSGGTGGSNGGKGGRGGAGGSAGTGHGGTGSGGTGNGGTSNGGTSNGGNAGNVTSGGTGGSAGSSTDPLGGCVMAPVASVATTTLIDDFEDGDTYAQSYGAWYPFDDGTAATGDQATMTLSTATRAGGNAHALELHTGVHTGYGSGLGLILADNNGTQDTFDVTAHDGIEFWARATNPGTVRVNFPDQNSDPQGGICTQAGGHCNQPWGTDLDLDSTWRLYRVHWDELYTQSSANEPFAPHSLYRVEFLVAPSTSLDFFVDDAHFFDTSSSAYAVSGRQFQKQGTKRVFHGLDRPSLEWDSHGEKLSRADLELMAGWGADTVRISLNQDFWLADSPSYDAGYAPLIDKMVSCAHSADLDVILDLHWSDRGDYGVTPGQQPMADAHSVEFWQELAARYKNNSRILFELYNEPHDVPWSVWRDGGPTTGFTAVGFQDLYDAVRGAGAENVVLAGGLQYAFDLSGVPQNRLRGYNIGYVTHPYNNIGKQPSDWPAAFGDIAAYYPVIATEFGDTTSCSASYNQSFITYAASLDISWTGWAWWVEATNPCAFPTLISDWNGTPTTAGAVVKAALSP